MIERIVFSQLIKSLHRSASVALVGPRQVGKTTLAHQLVADFPAVYLDLENRRDLQKIQDIALFHTANEGKLMVLAEVQRVPEIFNEIRGIIDEQRRKGNKFGQFLFLGSASLDLLKQSSESLAGRISYLELFGFNALEFKTDLNDLWLRGGYPESLLATNANDSFLWRQDFIKTYLERDIPSFGPRIPAATLDRFWTMLAHYQGSVLNAANLARSLDVSGVTIARYLDLMVDLLLVRRLKPWTFNAGKRLVRSPKVYVRDSGLVHALLNIQDYNELLSHPVVGGSWEGFVIENLLSVVPPGVQAFYYGTPGGAEIDLLLEFRGGKRWAIEIKRSSSPSLSKGFHMACEAVEPEKKYVVYSGFETFHLSKDVMALPLTQLMNELLQMHS